MKTTPTSPAEQRRGFTLVEAMVATVIAGLVIAGVLAFMLTVVRGNYWAANKAQITNDFRIFSMRLAKEARNSSAAYVYSSFDPADRDEEDDQQVSGGTGDCLVLVDTEPYPDVDDPHHVTLVIAYFRRPDNDGTGPVYRLEADYEPSNYVDTTEAGFSVEDLLKTIAPDNSGDYPKVLELSRGLADGSLFRSESEGRLIVVSGEILHGNEVKEVTNTYNLTISPRG